MNKTKDCRSSIVRSCHWKNRRCASMAIGAGIARHRAGAAMDQERQGYESQLDQSQRQIEA